jgi:alkylated DNA nucleotide flippase Atl1
VVGPGFHDRVYAVVADVPAGAITTYGDVAARLGLRSAARQVGYALAALPDGRDDVPWHRVVNARGELSRRSDGAPSKRQSRRLRAEGIEVTREGCVKAFDLRRHVFDGP